MQYMLLIYHNEANRMPPKEESAMLQDYMTFTQDIVKNGKFKAGDRLEPTANATTVRVRNGKTATVDGPFAEHLICDVSLAGRGVFRFRQHRHRSTA